MRVYICPSFRSSFRNSVILFRQRFLHNLQARKVRFGIQIDDDMLYRWIANQPSHAYSSLYLSNFLSCHTLNDEIFRQRFL